MLGVATGRFPTASVGIVLLTVFLAHHAELLAQEDRPELRLRASPNLAFAGTEISFTGLLRGGADDYEEFYCVSAEWDWDDGTRSESILDCDPYEPGSSEIRRRFAEDAYVCLPGFFAQDNVSAVREAVFTRLNEAGEIRGTPADGIYSGTSRRRARQRPFGRP